jgi:sigma-54 dependent transcriptional regulator, acetoin dehydrogenase operon transcriptional activator AcoR
LSNTDVPSSLSGRLAAAREQFLTAGRVDTEAVRRNILASWWRSRTWNVAADQIEAPYVEDSDLDVPLTRSAAPVLDRLQDQLADLPVSVILTDARGLVLDRRSQDGELTRQLDRVQLAPGFSYAEEHVGTNGIGTALEGRQPTAVFGHEHYAERLDTLGCAGVPIYHPVSGQVLGLLDLTCWQRDAGPLLMALAKATAQDIKKELTVHVGLRELNLFSEYLRACRRGQGIVLAVNDDLVMLNEHARQQLSPEDQAALLTRAAELLTAKREGMVTMNLPSGAQARLSCTPVRGEAGPAGGIVRARLIRQGELRASATPVHPLPGVVGSGALWLRACHAVNELARAREWTLLEGEPGTGKLAIVRAVHTRLFPSRPCAVVDLADTAGPTEWVPAVRQALRTERSTLVLRHLDQLSRRYHGMLARVLTDERRRGRLGAWVVATTDESGHEDLAPDVLRRFPASVSVPPLRHHIDDIRELVPFLLVKLSPGANLSCSPATIQLLLRTKWSGNVAQLQQVLRKVVQNRRSGLVEPEHLPPECRATTSRVLNPLESMERDAIVSGLLDAEGNRSKAAKALGMSRATIYRKIREYGIDIPG